MEDQADILDAWAEEDQGVRLRFSKIGCLWALLLIPAGVTLDVLAYPDVLAEFFLLRLANDLFILAILLGHFTPVVRRHLRGITLAWLVTPQITICYMIYLADGFGSTYYAGLNLAILAMGMVLPVTVSEVVTLVALTMGMYVVAGFAHGAEDVNYGLLYNNLYFMLTTSVISAIAVYFNRQRRFTEFRLNFELTKRNEELAELDRVKSEFFANISHEFRTPLTLILAPLERLMEEQRNLPARVTEKLDLIRQNSLRLLRLVNDLLDVIRLEEGRVDLDRHTLRLDTLLCWVVEAMSHLAEARGISISNELSDAPVWIAGDRGALEKVFFNLLSNAIKFTNEGGRITIASRAHAESLTVTVADTGIGMSPDSLPHIFGRFRQADSSATRRYSGTGLGLALVKELTERHDGTVAIRSTPGEGTIVTVVLPTLRAESVDPQAVQDEPDAELDSARLLDVAAQQSAVSAPRGLQTGAQDMPETGNGTVLVVDDEPDMRRYLVDLLQDEYRVLLARDGREALEMTERFRPELIVLDLMLPEIDGLEVCRRIKQNPDLRSSRIVLLTARAEEPSKLVALDNGADDFLTKPFSSIEVKTRLRNLRHSVALEQDLHSRNHELQHTLDELRDTQDKLIHSEKLNALGRLSAGLLHEINNPLNYTLTALEFAKNDPLLDKEEDLKETLADIDDGMQRIRGIVKELRAFAYPSRSDRAEFQLSKAIDAALHILAHEARSFHVENRVQGDWVAIGSSNHVTQVVVNLLSNAFKAMRALADKPPGNVSLSARQEGGRIFISVRDNGPGMSEDVMGRIFDPFYTTADVGEGMGMGLSVCQTIIGNHDGHLVVHSEQGAWTEFTFDLTLAESQLGDGTWNDDRVLAQ